MKPHILIILYHPSDCMLSWHYSSCQSHNSKSFKTRHTYHAKRLTTEIQKNTTANTVFTSSHTYISKHLLIQYGLLGANDLRLARLKSGAKRRTQKEPEVIQDEHKVFPWLQTKCLPGHVGTLCCTSVRSVSAVDNFANKMVHLHTGVHMFVDFWMQHFQTGGLGEMVRHLGHHDRWISPPLDFFLWGMLRTKCFRHQFQISQIWRQE